MYYLVGSIAIASVHRNLLHATVCTNRAMSVINYVLLSWQYCYSVSAQKFTARHIVYRMLSLCVRLLT